MVVANFNFDALKFLFLEALKTLRFFMEIVKVFQIQ